MFYLLSFFIFFTFLGVRARILFNFITSFLLRTVFNGHLVALFTRPCLNTNFYYYFQETLFEIAKHTMPNPPPFDRFGFFLTKNASREADLPLYTMYTGEGDPYKLSTIAAVDGSTNLGKNPHY
jgi:hypothetical protein